MSIESPETAPVKHFSIDARAMLTWGRDSIKDHTTAVLELVKNSYDAGATIVHVYLSLERVGLAEPYIRISDNGSGMTEDDVDTKWLRIGFSEKKVNTKIKDRRKTGEKGVGRISADRLGGILELRTQAATEESVGLSVNWDLFEATGSDIQSVDIAFSKRTSFLIPQPSIYDKDSSDYLAAPAPAENSLKNTGTEIVIRNLRQVWETRDIQMLRESLAGLTSPLDGEVDFQIRIEEHNGVRGGKVISSPFYKRAQIEATFDYGPKSGVHYTMADRDDEGNISDGEEKIVEWTNFIHRGSGSFDAKSSELSQPSGPIRVHLLFYLRDKSGVENSTLKLADLRQFLDLHAGVKVYRDNIRVMPYGDPRKPEGDWLGLGQRKAAEPAGPARPTWKVSPTQLVGHVYLTRDGNPGISDTSAREGLIHGEDFAALRAFIFGCVIRLEAHYHRQFLKKRAAPKEAPSPRETVRAFSADLQSLKNELEEAESELGEETSPVTMRLRGQLSETIQKVTALRRSIDQLASQATIYRGLATLGIAVATFGHEIESSLEQFMTSAIAVTHLLSGDAPAINAAITEIGKSIKAGKNISAWGAYALRRVNSEKRVATSFDVAKILEKLLTELEPAISSAGITISTEFESVTIESFAMDIESIFINLLTNAYFFTLHSGNKREINIKVNVFKSGDHEGFSLSVADSGPGVSEDIVDNIWEPLFTTKIDAEGRSVGTGLGLSIVDTALKDLGGKRTVERDLTLGGAKFTVNVISRK